MSDTRELLNIQLQECDNADEAAALLTELAELSLSEVGAYRLGQSVSSSQHAAGVVQWS